MADTKIIEALKDGIEDLRCELQMRYNGYPENNRQRLRDFAVLERAESAIRELERASQPGSGEAVSGAEWLALANQAHALKSSRETENESRYRFLRAQYIAADFDWNGEAVLIFRIPASTAVSADCDSTVDAARASLDGRRES